MKARILFGSISRNRLLVCALAIVFVTGASPACAWWPRRAKHTGRIPIAEFSRMVQEFSEPGGVFHSDNFTSNELSYLHVVGKLKDLGVSGGAYIGVGPEQNFTYIAKIRPRIAFIVDIRRQAILQHLMYKAIFHLASDRAQFLSLLFSKPLPKIRSEKNQSIEELLERISKTPASKKAFWANFKAIRKTIEKTFRVPLLPEDVDTIGYVYSAFRQENLDIGYRFGSHLRIRGYWGFPTLRQLILATDLKGRKGNFLAREEDYQFVRKLQEENRVIPVVGNFAGPRALRAVAHYLRRNGYTVSAFYTSNVEEYLYDHEAFGRFAANVGELPISNRSVFIRAVREAWAPHSFWAASDRMTPYLQKISVFLKDFRAGLLPDYRSLITTHYIGNPAYLPTKR